VPYKVIINNSRRAVVTLDEAKRHIRSTGADADDAVVEPATTDDLLYEIPIGHPIFFGMARAQPSVEAVVDAYNEAGA
jgi:hypothetical protein